MLFTIFKLNQKINNMEQKNNFYLITLLAVCLSTVSCKTTQLLTEPPDTNNGEYPNFPALEKLSTIQIPISVPLDAVNRQINNRVPEKFSIDYAVECPEIPTQGQEYDCKLKGDIDIGKVNMSGNGGNLNFSTNVGGRITFFWSNRWEVRIPPFGPTISHHEDHDKNLHFKGNLLLSASPTINEEWRLIPNLKGDINFSEAYFHFGAEISVRGKLMEKLKPKLDENISDIENKIKQDITIKNKLTPFWNSLKKPIKVSDEYNVWSTIYPDRIYFNDINVSNNKINLAIGLGFKTKTYVGSKPNDIQPPVIPNLTKQKNQDNSINLNIPVLLEYTELTKIANEKTAGKEFNAGDKVKVTFDRIDLYGDSKNVFIKAKIRAKHKLTKAEGTVYLLGVPYLDNINQIVQIRDVEFDLKTKNFLLNSANWLLHKKVIEKIEEKAIFDLKPSIEKAKSSVNEKLSNVHIDDKLKIKGRLDLLSLDNLILSEKALIVSMQLSGRSEVEVLKLD